MPCAGAVVLLASCFRRPRPRPRVAAEAASLRTTLLCEAATSVSLAVLEFRVRVVLAVCAWSLFRRDCRLCPRQTDIFEFLYWMHVKSGIRVDDRIVGGGDLLSHRLRRDVDGSPSGLTGTTPLTMSPKTTSQERTNPPKFHFLLRLNL